MCGCPLGPLVCALSDANPVTKEREARAAHFAVARTHSLRWTHEDLLSTLAGGRSAGRTAVSMPTKTRERDSPRTAYRASFVP
jgi:hypothetical protein